MSLLRILPRCEGNGMRRLRISCYLLLDRAGNRGWGQRNKRKRSRRRSHRRHTAMMMTHLVGLEETWRRYQRHHHRASNLSLWTLWTMSRFMIPKWSLILSPRWQILILLETPLCNGAKSNWISRQETWRISDASSMSSMWPLDKWALMRKNRLSMKEYWLVRDLFKKTISHSLCNMLREVCQVLLDAEYIRRYCTLI